MITTALLAVLCAVYLFAQVRLLRLDLFFAVAYFYLFVYVIFALVGYIYFPDLSESISAYFGPQVIAPALIFLILSFLGIYFTLFLLSPLRVSVSRVLGARRARFDYFFATSLAVGCVLSALLFGLLQFWEGLSYANAASVDFIESQGVFYQLWFVLLKDAVFFLTILYSVYRLEYWKQKRERAFLAFYLIALSAAVLVITYRVGDRVDLIALFNGLVFVEFIYADQNSGRPIRKTLPKLLIAGAVVLVYASWVEINRATGAAYAQDWYEVFFLNDYFPPAHMLFAAIHYHLVNPIEVLVSNFENSLVLLKHPYLQEYVTGTFDPDAVVTRASSYAFFLLSEGYLAMGDFGFIYNSLMVSAGLMLWRLFSCTSSARLNSLIVPVIAVNLTNLCRGQSSYFIKFIYINLVPACLFIFCATGYYFTIALDRSSRRI